MALISSRTLSAFLLGLVGTLPLVGDRCAAEEAFDPYLVYVDQEGVTARCGPGGDYYRTDPLRHGQRLEVYLETEDGWLGVRPPEGSFCWIPADSVELDRSGSSGRITEEATLAWIGTHLGKARKYMWQIQMPRGEDVTILGRAEREGPDGPQLWYRIVPPSGEFRWVHRDQIVDNPELLLRDKPRQGDRLAQGTPTPVDDLTRESSEQSSSRRSRGMVTQSILQPVERVDAADQRAKGDAPVQLHALDVSDAVPLAIAVVPSAAAKPYAGAEPMIDPASYSPPLAPHDAEDRYAFSTAPVMSGQPIGSGIDRGEQPPLMAITSQPIVRNIGATGDESLTVPASDANWVRGSSRSARTSDPQNLTVPGGPPRMDHRASISSPASASQGGVFPSGGSVDALQLELTRRMVASARASELEPLRLAADEIARNHTSESERQRAGLLAQRVQQVQAVARRRDGESEPIGPLGSHTAPGVGSAVAIPGGQLMLPLSGPAPSEVAGYLVQVYSARPDSPPFALTDAAGRTTHYVSPSPGVNLRRFLNQHITIGGQSGYETGLDTPHIIASGAVRSPELR